MTLKVGLFVGREWSFPPAFIEEVNNRNEGVVAEFVKIGSTRMDEPCPYAVIIDRISHEVPYYRLYLVCRLLLEKKNLTEEHQPAHDRNIREHRTTHPDPE